MEPRLLDLVRALTPGATVWVPSAGNSLWPVIHGGDFLLVRRCGSDALHPGDVALVEGPTSLIAHIVATVEPLSTVSIVGVPDPPALPALGRVIAIRRGQTRIPLPEGLRPLLRLTPRAALLLKQVALFQALVRRIRDGRAPP